MDSSSVDALRQVPIFSDLDDDSLKTLARRSRRRKFRAKAALFHEGDPGHTLYVIVSGRVKIQTNTVSGEIVHLANRGPGEQFGELSLIDGKPRMADAVTSEKSDLLMLDRSDFFRCVGESPAIAIGVMASLADRLRQAADQRESQQELNVLGRVSEVLIEMAENLGIEDPGVGLTIDAKVSQLAIADQIGTARESVNRAFASLRAVGAIQTEGRTVTIRNMAKLKQYCSK